MKGLVAALCLTGQAAAADCLTLGDLGYVLPVEGDVTVTELPNEVMLDLAPGGRAPKIIRIGSLAGVDLTGASARETKVLSNGLIARYGTTVGDAAGSGGAEVFLSGWLEGDVPVSIGCMTQQEYTNPEWCLPILGELRPAANGCEAKED